jgi:hypothetical protein
MTLARHYEEAKTFHRDDTVAWRKSPIFNLVSTRNGGKDTLICDEFRLDAAVMQM